MLFYTIGTSQGHPDVVKFTNVGVVKEVIVTGLTLQHGLTYYATVRGDLYYIIDIYQLI